MMLIGKRAGEIQTSRKRLLWNQLVLLDSALKDAMGEKIYSDNASLREARGLGKRRPSLERKIAATLASFWLYDACNTTRQGIASGGGA